MAVKEGGSTADYRFNGLKLLVFGPPDSGKTYAISTAPKPFVFMADKGGLSLKDFDIPCDTIKTGADFEDAVKWILDNKASAKYDTFCFDDLTTIGDIVLTEEAAKITNPKDYLGKYNALQARLLPQLRLLRDVSTKHMYFTCKEYQDKDTKLFCPDFPGTAVTKELPYFFDFVFQLKNWVEPSTGQVVKDENGQPYRIFKTKGDYQCAARSRQGTVPFLADMEQAHVGMLIDKVRNNVK